ncbi:MAG: hypothetical protein Q8S33_36610 [Myxococcales bacterium]|nr:hypothetical protein [Myxococcales bacterium]
MNRTALLSLVLMSCATVDSSTTGPASPPTPPPDGLCLTGRDGQTVCGYKCLMGSDGRVGCAETKAGQCLMGSDGRVACGLSCATGSDGMTVCSEVPGRTCSADDGPHAQCR